ETDRLTRTITLVSAERLGTRLTVQEYRQTAVGIGREVVGERFAAGYRAELGQSSSRGRGVAGAGENEADSEEDGEDPLELQSAHTTAIGMVAYAVQADLVQGLSMRSIDVFRTLSHAWHAFLGFAQATEKKEEEKKEGEKQLKRKKSRGRDEQLVQHDSAGAADSGAEQKRLRVSNNSPSARTGNDQRRREQEEKKRQLEDAVRQVLAIPPSNPVTYKSAEQDVALYAVARGISPLIVVLPTGGGKTLLPMAAAETGRQSVTILILPFRALIEDMLVRLRKASIKGMEWQAGAEGDYLNRRTPASVVVVSADYVGCSSGQFLSYASLLARQGVLC
ncbi:hypothetical protein BDW02DRAFT_613307, partial [Decorospora gaudefroyi]